MNSFRITIGTKLIALIAFLLISSIASIVWLSTQMFVESDTALIQQSNSDTAMNLAIQTRGIFQDLNEKIKLFSSIISQKDIPGVFQERFKKDFFTKDQDLIGIFIIQENPLQINHYAISPESEELKQVPEEKLLAMLHQKTSLSLSNTFEGEVQISSIPFAGHDSIIIFSIPYIQDPSKEGHFTHLLVGVVKQNRFIQAFSESEAVTSFMVDKKGKLLAHPNVELVNAQEKFIHLEIVKQMLNGKFNNGQTRYIDPRTQQAKLGAFRLVGFGGLGVIAEVDEAKAFSAAKKVENRSILIGWIILCISFLLGYLYSNTITWPIQLLSLAALKISQGDFKIHLSTKGNDELAHLSSTFNEMAIGLQERDRVKETFNKFHNKEITDKLLSGEVKLGGERKEATVFFSDVRGFTSLSESLEPEQVVEMLNEYMTRMVSIIRKYGGVVDKYVGDAIMALWGAPITNEGDTSRAVRACLEMRKDLANLNELRLSRNQPVLKIGMGLNRGPLIAGNIGSNEKMEYTVIGDAVNLASRIESMTKEYGTDLLVSQSIRSELENQFLFDVGGTTKVKGKAEPIVVYKVKGYVDEQGQAVIIETPYSSYAAEKSDKVVHEHPISESPQEHTSPELASSTNSIPSPPAFMPSPPPFPTPPSPSLSIETSFIAQPILEEIVPNKIESTETIKSDLLTEIKIENQEITSQENKIKKPRSALFNRKK